MSQGTLSLGPLQRGSGAMENQEASSPSCQGDMEALIAQGDTRLPPGLRFRLFSFFLSGLVSVDIGIVLIKKKTHGLMS